ncbi:hypothetical protein AB0I22_13235 [Streptomyces sp. NPDC050610]
MRCTAPYYEVTRYKAHCETYYEATHYKAHCETHYEGARPAVR